MKLIERLFLKMQSVYGNRFNDIWHGIGVDSVKSTWIEYLGGFTPVELADAINLCVDERDYPPNLPQFIELARRKPLQKFRALESKGMNKEEAVKIILEIKKRFPAFFERKSNAAM